jgi:hypothetical protein
MRMDMHAGKCVCANAGQVQRQICPWACLCRGREFVSAGQVGRRIGTHGVVRLDVVVGGSTWEMTDLAGACCEKLERLWLGQDTRITRGDVGSVFVLVKDVSLQQPITAIAAAELNAEAALSAEFEE